VFVAVRSPHTLPPAATRRSHLSPPTIWPELSGSWLLFVVQGKALSACPYLRLFLLLQTFFARPASRFFLSSLSFGCCCALPSFLANFVPEYHCLGSQRRLASLPRFFFFVFFSTGSVRTDGHCAPHCRFGGWVCTVSRQEISTTIRGSTLVCAWLDEQKKLSLPLYFPLEMSFARLTPQRHLSRFPAPSLPVFDPAPLPSPFPPSSPLSWSFLHAVVLLPIIHALHTITTHLCFISLVLYFYSRQKNRDP
jgi:hypothetical protein